MSHDLPTILKLQTDVASSEANGMSLSGVKASLNAVRSSNETPKINSVWRHYKGKYYIVAGMGMLESTEELVVRYYDPSDSLLYDWIRPLSEWNAIVQDGENKIRRFTEVEEQFNTEQEVIRRMLDRNIDWNSARTFVSEESFVEHLRRLKKDMIKD